MSAPADHSLNAAATGCCGRSAHWVGCRVWEPERPEREWMYRTGLIEVRRVFSVLEKAEEALASR